MALFGDLLFRWIIRKSKRKGATIQGAPFAGYGPPLWKEITSLPKENGGVRQAHPDQPCETIVARRAKNVKPSFAAAHSGRLPLPTSLPRLSRPEHWKPLLPGLQWEGARLPDRTHRGGPSQRLGGAARQSALRSPGAPSGGGRGGGEAGESPTTQHRSTKRKTTKRTAPKNAPGR